jgi:hypothetical protein
MRDFNNALFHTLRDRPPRRKLVDDPTRIPAAVEEFLRLTTGLRGWLSRVGVPAGFFFSSLGSDRTSPNALIVLVYTGAIVLAAGLASLGIGLLAA